jgi:PAS domain S-box-containing protein
MGMIGAPLGNLRNRLLAVVLLGIAPALFAAMLLVVAILAQDVRKGMTEANVSSLVRLVGEIHDRALESTRTVLASLAAEHNASPDHCANHFRRILAETRDLDGLLMLTPTGAVRCAGTRGGDVMWMARLPVVTAALESGRLAAGPHLYSGADSLSLPLAAPVIDDDGRVVAVIVTVRNVNWLTRDLTHQVLPAGGHMAIVNRAATVIARLDSRASVGMEFPVATVARAIRHGNSQSLVATDPTGTDRIYSFGRLSQEIPDIFAVISVPETMVLGPAHSFFWLTIGSFALAGLATIGMLYLASRRLVFAPTARLLDVIRQVEAGDRTARAGSVQAYGELERIAFAFDTMLDEMDRRQTRFRELFDQSPDAIMVHDLSGRFTDANTAALRLTGFPRDSLLSMDVFDLVPDADPARLSETWAALQPGRPVTVTGTLRRSDKVLLPIETYLAPLGAGDRHQVVAVIRDMSAQIRARDALEVALDQARSANRAKSDFLASMSHELRTPLNAVIGFGETMALEVFGPIPPKYKEYAQDIVDSGSHLLDLITDILDLAKIEAGRMDLTEEWVELNALIEAAAKLLRDRAESGGVTLKVALPPALPAVLGDRRRLKQVVINLLTNAVKFTPAGGTVTVSATALPGQGLELVVDDTGIGIAKVDIPRALEPFGQIGRSVTRTNEGTGLGLALVRGILDMHGGRMDIDSAPGRGTTVTVHLPAGRLARGS